MSFRGRGDGKAEKRRESVSRVLRERNKRRRDESVIEVTEERKFLAPMIAPPPDGREEGRESCANARTRKFWPQGRDEIFRN